MQISQKHPDFPTVPLIGVAVIVILLLFKIIPNNSQAKGCEAVISASFECKQVTVMSSKDVSNVTVYLVGHKAIKFDNMKVGAVWSYSSDDVIEAVSVKSGCTSQTFDNNECDVLLPVTWAYVRLNGHLLTWGTHSELNNDKFVIYGIDADLNKDSLGTVLGNGTTLEENGYSFVMKQHYLYAVVMQQDYDGTAAYSKVAVNSELVVPYRDGTKYDVIGRMLR